MLDVDCFKYRDGFLCNECGEAERDDIHDGSGRPAIFWEHAKSDDYPQRSSAQAALHCDICGECLGEDALP